MQRLLSFLAIGSYLPPDVQALFGVTLRLHRNVERFLAPGRVAAGVVVHNDLILLFQGQLEEVAALLEVCLQEILDAMVAHCMHLK